MELSEWLGWKTNLNWSSASLDFCLISVLDPPKSVTTIWCRPTNVRSMSHVLISCEVSFENDHTWPRNKHWYLNMCLHLTYPSSQNAEPLLASKHHFKGFHLEAHVSFEHAKPRKPWYLIWKQMSTSSRSPISHPHSDFEPDAREIRESLGDLTSASPQTHKSAEKFTQMLRYLCWLCQFLKFEQNKSIGCFSDVTQYHNSEVVTSH